MSDTPFGFGVPPEEPEDGDEGKKKGQPGRRWPGRPANPFGFGGRPGGAGGGDNPFAAMFGSLNPNDLGAAFQQLGQMLSYEGGPVNWDMAKDIARQTVAAGHPGRHEGRQRRPRRPRRGRGGRAPGRPVAGRRDLAAVRVPARAVAWSRAEWVEATLPVWKELVDPVAERVGAAMGDVLPEEMQAMAGPLLGMMRSMGGAMFGTQIGQALGVLAGEVVGSTDIGLPLGPAGKAALLPANVAAFGKGLGVPQEEVRLYLALREAAHQRLFAHVPWLRSHLFGAVEGYARGIKVDTAKLEDVVGQLDPHATPSSCRRRSSRACSSPRTPRSRRPRWPGWRRRWRWSRAGWTRWCTRPPSPASAVRGRAARDAAPPPGLRRSRPSRPSPR